MKKIKVFRDTKLQTKIDKWIEEENPIILSTSISATTNQNTGNVIQVISIVYE